MPVGVAGVRQWDRQKSQEELDAMFDSMWDNDAVRLALASQPPAITTPLQEHQMLGVAWMLEREQQQGGRLPSFWEERREQSRPAFFNSITNSSQPDRPHAVAGGLLADDMGLGKTLHVLALVIANPRPGLEVRGSNEMQQQMKRNRKRGSSA